MGRSPLTGEGDGETDPGLLPLIKASAGNVSLAPMLTEISWPLARPARSRWPGSRWPESPSTSPWDVLLAFLGPDSSLLYERYPGHMSINIRAR